MKVKTIKLLKQFLSKDNDFYNIWKLKKNNSSKKDFLNDLNNFIDSMNYDGLLDYYLIYKKYIDISYVILNDEIINLDDLYTDWQFLKQA